MHVADDDAPKVLEYLPAPHAVQDVADNPTDEYGDRLPRTRGRVVEDEEQVRPEKTSG